MKIGDVKPPRGSKLAEYINSRDDEVFTTEELIDRYGYKTSSTSSTTPGDNLRGTLRDLFRKKKVYKLRLSPKRTYWGSKKAIETLKRKLKKEMGGTIEWLK